MAPKRRIVAGVDSSTQSCKIVTVDADSGELLQLRSAPHPDGTSVDPAHWWDAFVAAGGTELGDAQALGVSAQQHGMVALDESGTAVHDALLWNDVRSAPQAAALVKQYGAEMWADEIGVVPVASFTITKLAWLHENRPELAARVEQVLLPHDWLTWNILGRPSEAVTDRSDASGTGYFSAHTNEYRPDLLRAALGRDARLPRVLAPNERAGVTPQGVIVSAGAGDNASAALGLGIGEGDVVVSIGTSGTVFASTAARISDPSGAVAGFADAAGGQLPLLATINGARTLVATARMLGVDIERFGELALAAPIDADGLLMLPYLDGERTPNLPDATGSLTGMRRSTMTPEHLAQASVLGLVCSLADALDSLRGQGVSVQRVILIGGGSQSPAVQKIAADVFGVPVVLPKPGEYVALGAARQAAWALDGSPDFPAWPLEIARELEPAAGAAGSGGADWALAVRANYASSRAHLYGV
ncbi:xylulokinase [Cryobacterium melibiosiphilum]|uniref:Xylulose kinase n=1 Tax=Cryobacterium melibiosiphilum TaxID=995039 RepID=A0A3A5MIZ2_9MICO|nr:xylulokinase [Cryobacterium melibiosiphilum]RJT87899.1 xylulokinase [Cryobacterium melibiosiphilum]